jgi:predicted SPOUT superfamily RNA methylase MTH1
MPFVLALDRGSFVDIGYERNAHVAQVLPEGARVTLAVGNVPTPCFVPAFSATMLEVRNGELVPSR